MDEYKINNKTMAHIKLGVEMPNNDVIDNIIMGMRYAFYNANLPVPVVTGGSEVVPGRSSKSKHYRDQALDFRISTIPNTEILNKIVSMVKSTLGPNYDVVLESDHIHIEYDPGTAFGTSVQQEPISFTKLSLYDFYAGLIIYSGRKLTLCETCDLADRFVKESVKRSKK